MGIVYPVKEVILPKDLKGAENGKLDPKLLKAIKPGGKLHHLAANAWEAMRVAAEKEGITFAHVGDYRPYEAQLSMFKDRYVKGDSGDPRKITRKFNDEVWMLKKGMAPAGSPGTSNHGWGLAIDIALKVDGKVVSIMEDPDGKGKGVKSGLDWLFANADKYGFSWEIKEGAQAEAWHIRYFTGDKIPAAVAEHFGGAVTAASAPAAAPAAPAAPAAKSAAQVAYPGTPLQLGSTGDAVKALQEKLGVAVTGTFDKATGAAVKKYKTANGLASDGIAGPKVWTKLFA